jgi:hypothetical protein
MAIQSAIYKVERPKSLDDSNHEQFEYLLAWYSKSGQYIQYLFTDWNYRQQNKNSILNRLSKAKINTIHGSEERTVTVTAENVTLNDLMIYTSILSAKEVVRVFKDGTTERVGIDSNSFGYRQTDARYNFEFDIVLYEKALPR